MSPTTGTVDVPLGRVQESSGPAPRLADGDPPLEHTPGLELLGPMKGSAHHSQPFLVRRGDGQTIQLTELLYATLAAVDGDRSLDAVAGSVSHAVRRHATAEDVAFLVEHKLRPLGLVREADGSTREVSRTNPLLALRFRWVVSDPGRTRRLTDPFVWLFRPVVVGAVLVAFVLTSAWVLFEKGLAAPAHHAFDTPGLLLGVFFLSLLSAGFHEFGHAAACRYGGATPGSMGAGLYLLWPAFYTEVTDSYRLGRGGRLRVDLGGLYFNAVFGVAIFALWSVTRLDALLLVLPVQLLQMLRQLTPFVRADGYHIIADLVGVPDLFAHIKPTLLGVLPTRWGRPESKQLKWWARVVLLGWVLAVLPLLVTSMVLAVLFLPRLAASAWVSLQEEWTQLVDEVGSAQLGAAMLSVISLIAIALPVLAISYLLWRVVSRTVRRVVRATDGRPVLRSVAAVGAVLVVLFVSWSWWPRGQYQPIRGDEQGTAQDLLSLHLSKPARDTEALPAAGHGSMPGTGAPEPAMVLIPRDAGGGAPALVITVPEPDAAPVVRTIEPSEDGGWPFPFPAPPPPAEGDNRAFAVNTQDGGVVYDLAFSLVWVVDDDVEHRNEAWALASCQDCETVAVAFQTILIVGRADVIKPVNAAVSINFECTLCDTSAIAVQLVATLNAAPGADVIAKIEAIWERVEALEDVVAGLDAGEIYTLVKGFEAEILEVLLTSGPVDATSTTSADGLEPGSGTSTTMPAPTTTETATTDPAVLPDSSSDASTTTSEPPTTEPPATEPPTTEPPPPPPETTTTQPEDTTATTVIGDGTGTG